MELAQDAANVLGHGALVEHEYIRDLPVPQSLCDEFQRLEFAGCEFIDHHLFYRPIVRACQGPSGELPHDFHGNLGGKGDLAASDIADRLEELVGVASFRR